MTRRPSMDVGMLVHYPNTTTGLTRRMRMCMCESWLHIPWYQKFPAGIGYLGLGVQNCDM